MGLMLKYQTDLEISDDAALRKEGSAREFGETANSRALGRFALPGISGDRITRWGTER